MPPSMPSRRNILTAAGAFLGAASSGPFLPSTGLAAAGALRIGLTLPFSGTLAQIGNNVANGFRLALLEQDGKLGGRNIEVITLDDESDPAKAVENASKLVLRDKVDILVGTVHSGVQMGVQKVARETGVLNIIPNAGLHAATRGLCAPNIFRSSFANSQASRPLGAVMMARGHKTAVWITWKYAAGDESYEGFEEGYTKSGGTIVKSFGVPFPAVEFQALLTEIAAIKPDAVAAYFAGGGAAKFLKDYAAAGLKGKIPLYGPGFLTDGVLDAVDGDAEGVITTLYYGDGLDLPRNHQFRASYVKTYGSQPDVYSVNGYDAALLLIEAADAVKGELSDKPAVIKALENAVIDSPRGKWTMSKAHNPIMDIYLRQVEGNQNKVIGYAARVLEDSGAGCKMR